MTTADELLDSNAAARVLSISTRHLAKLRDNGAIPIVRISPSRRGVRYSRADLSAFIASRSCKPTKGKQTARTSNPGS